MIEIKKIDGSVIFSVLPDEDAVFHEELMSSDYVQLSWVSDEYQVIPAGAYIEYDGEKYKLLENYTPTQQDECTYQYTPQFQSRVMNWDKQITPVYTYESNGTTVKSREMDWEFTGSPADAMYIVKQAIKNETGENWTVQLADSLPATITISSQSSSIYSILNTIADECETEWWADKKTNTLYLSKCIFGNPVTLEVGNNVQVPSVTSDSDGYYTRFYAFGSTRNITQDYDGGQATNSIVNKRLTLNPAKYPNGYKDIKSGLQPEEVFVKVLYFDEIYPSSKLTISDVRARLRYRLDNSGQKVIVGGTEEEPVYEQYAIWYFQIAGFTFDPATDVIEGLNLSVSFESGQLAGRDFELTYHESAETVSDSNDITPFEIKAGDYEIVIDETSGQIIPGTSYIIPQDGDSVVLYNIVMPDEYVTSAQDELESELDKAMLSYTEDNNTYQMESDPTRFYENNTDIQMGQAVTYVNGTKSLSTRVQMVEKRLDLSCYQTIKIGNKIIKGNTQQLKDEVASANQNIDVIKAFNDLSTSLSQAYANAQREMIEGFAAIKNLWTLETDEQGNKYAYTQYDIFGKGGITAFTSKAQVPSIFDGFPLDNVTIWKNPDTGLIEVIGGTGGGGEAGSVAWGNITDKPTTLAGYGIQASDVLSTLKTVDGSGSGLDADTLDGYHANSLLTSMSSSRSVNLSVTVGGTTKTISSIHADYAYSFANTRYLWGQPFDGTSDVSGTLTGVSDIIFTGAAPFNIDANGNIKASTNSDSNYWHIDRYDGGNVLKILSSTGAITISYVSRINFLNSGSAYYDANGNVHQTATSDSAYWNVISSNNVTSLCVTALNGYVGINTSSPSQKLHVIGNILATGGVTLYSSDIRAKTVIERPKLSLNSIANAPVIKFRWNGYSDLKDDGKLHIGGIAQYIEKILPECVVGQKEDFLSFDYATVGYIFSVQTARHLQSYETKTDREIRKLKKKILHLEKQLKKLGYEEVNTLAD